MYCTSRNHDLHTRFALDGVIALIVNRLALFSERRMSIDKTV